MNLKRLELILKYPAFAIVLIGLYLAYQRGWDSVSLFVFYSGLFMLLAGLLIRAKRMKG